MFADPITARDYPEGSTVRTKPLRDGWPIRSFDWPADGTARGSILFQGGRGDFFEKYLESFAYWHRAGWSVTAFDWRGQGGSGRVVPDTHVGHFDDFSLWIDDYAEYWAAWVKQGSGPHIAIAHSMGGHLLLRAIIEQRVVPDAAVLVAPMLGIETPPLPLGIARWLFGGLGKVGLARRPAWKANERPAAPWASRQKFLTHDDRRYQDELWWIEQQPALQLGPPSFGWLSAAIASTRQSEAPGKLESVDCPVLMLGTDGDKLVSPAAIRRFAARMPSAQLHMYDDSVAHEILRERDEPRSDALRRIDDFLNSAVRQK